MAKKSLKRVGIALFVICLVLVYILVERKPVLAEKNEIDAIKDILSENGVSYQSVTESNQIITAELVSEGEGRCTIDDVKALQTLNDALYADERLHDIKGLQVNIYNADGEMIYDAYTAKNLTAAAVRPLLLNSVSDASEETIREKAADLMADYPCQIKDIVYTQQNAGSSTLEINLTATQEDAAAFMDVAYLYAKLEANLAVFDGLAKCIVNLESEDGECWLYVIGDFVQGECTTWVSPEIQDVFVEVAGPAPIEE